MDDRTKYIGGSDVCAILGLCKYKSPLDVFLNKVNKFTSYNENRYIRWGNILESTIIKEFEKDTGKKVSKMGTKYSEDYDFLAANVDGFIKEENAVLEIKTCDSRLARMWGEEMTDQIPQQYLLQVAHYCYVLNADKAYICVLIGGNDFRTYLYKRNPFLEKRIEEKLVSFWTENVMKKIEPDEINIQDAINKYSESEPESFILAGNDEIDIHEQIKKLDTLIKDLEVQKDELKLKIMRKMKCGESMITNAGDKLFSWKSTTTNRFDSKKLKEEDSETYDKYIKKSESRRFLVK